MSDMNDPTKIPTSQLVDEYRREYALYTLQDRAIPSLADGLKSAARRVIWTARDGAKWKTASLAGATMPIHPHGAPEGTIDTNTGPFINNLPLFEPLATFGTILKPTAFGAARYTSVKLSKFTKEAILVDLDIIPMKPNYDDTLTEPAHFLPLIPVVLLNGQSGIAVGFAADILPRDLDDIIASQLQHLTGKPVVEYLPYSYPINQRATAKLFDKKTGKPRFTFSGSFTRVGVQKVNITSLPYETYYEDYITYLNDLIDNGSIIDYDDDCKGCIDFTVKFDRAYLASATDEQLIKLLSLRKSKVENMNVIHFNGTHLLSTDYLGVIAAFTDWRLGWYIKRYERLLELCRAQIQRYVDVITAITMGVGSVATKVQNKQELVELLEAMGIVNTDYIAQLPIYRLTDEEKQKIEVLLVEARISESNYSALVDDGDLRRAEYIKELKQLQVSMKKSRK